eukprot:gene15959-22091_t
MNLNQQSTPLPSAPPKPACSPRDSMPREDEQVEAVWKAKRFAVKFGPPPCVFLEYEDEELKRRIRAVKLSPIMAFTDVDRLTRKVIRSFPRKLDASSVKYPQVRNLVLHTQEQHSPTAAAAAPQKAHLAEDVSHGLTPVRKLVAKLVLHAQEQHNAATAAAAAQQKAHPAEDLSHGRIPVLHRTQSPNISRSKRPTSAFASASAHAVVADSIEGALTHSSCAGSAASSIDRFSTSTGGASRTGSDDLGSPNMRGQQQMGDGPLQVVDRSHDLDITSLGGALSRDGSMSIVDNSLDSCQSLGRLFSSSTYSPHSSLSRLDARSSMPSPKTSSSTSNLRVGSSLGMRASFEPSRSRLAKAEAKEAEYDDSLAEAKDAEDDDSLAEAKEAEDDDSLAEAKEAEDDDSLVLELDLRADADLNKVSEADFGPPVEANDWDSDSDDEGSVTATAVSVAPSMTAHPSPVRAH